MLRCLAVALLLAATTSPALAVLEEDRRERLDPPPETTPTVTLCRDGKVWDDAVDGCVAPESSSLDDDRLFAAARALAYAGRYDDALKVAGSMRDAEDPRALTVRGFALRRSGQVYEGLALYAAALARDPDFGLTRAYLGLYFVETGQHEAAAEQLAEIVARGGEGTWPHAVLADALRVAK
jgi:tetratricopeptide (TPR) repeat protein